MDFKNWLLLETSNLQMLEAAIDELPNPHGLLIYADWLEEQGDMLGEFIRISLANIHKDKDKKLTELTKRYNELESELRHKFLGRYGFISNSLIHHTVIKFGRDNRYYFDAVKHKFYSYEIFGTPKEVVINNENVRLLTFLMVLSIPEMFYEETRFEDKIKDAKLGFASSYFYSIANKLEKFLFKNRNYGRIFINDILPMKNYFERNKNINIENKNVIEKLESVIREIGLVEKNLLDNNEKQQILITLGDLKTIIRNMLDKSN